jgi:hypothetical protein
MIKRPRPADLLLWRSPVICFAWAVSCFFGFIIEGHKSDVRGYLWLSFSIVSFISGVWHSVRKKK